MNSFHLFLALLMLATGSICTLLVKWMDLLQAKGSDGVERSFRHPFLQSLGLFLGEIFCLVAFYVHKWKRRTEENEMNFNPLIFWPPALCDITGTCLGITALTLTYASSATMIGGIVIVFTGIMTTLFLRRNLECYRWIGIFYVLIGTILVGLCDFWHEDGLENNSTRITGDLLIVAATLIASFQLVYEEKFIGKYNVPALKAVGLEGIFGFLTLLLLCSGFYFIPASDKMVNNPRKTLVDIYDGFCQLADNPLLLLAFSLLVICNAFFNFAGISVTKEMSATTRVVLNSLRTLVIWIFALALQWEVFQWLQFIGFSIVIIGICVYNDILIAPLGRKLADSCRIRYTQLQNEPE